MPILPTKTPRSVRRALLARDTGIDPAVMQAYLDWEYGLVGQRGRGGTHGFWVLTP